MGFPGLCGQAGVVGQGFDALLAQPFCNPLHLVARQAVNDAGVAVVLGTNQAQ